MYIYDFLNSLEQLNKDFLPNSSFPMGNIEYLNYQDIQEISMNKDGHYYLAYKEKGDLSYHHYINIDEQINYINQLNQLNIDLRKTPLSQLDSALYEAIYLFDRLSSMDHNPYFQFPIYQGIRSVLNVYLRPHEFYEFHNNPINRDIFIAQFQYFIKKYLIIRLDKQEAPIHKGTPLPLKTRNCLVSYSNSMKRIQEHIRDRNFEFREFISHINQ